MTEAHRSADECPACGGKLIRHEADIGVGIQYGPWHCTECVWQEPQPDHGLINEENDFVSEF